MELFRYWLFCVALSLAVYFMVDQAQSFELQVPAPVHISEIGKVMAAVLIVDHTPKKKSAQEECLADILKTYADTCGEEDTDGPDAHYNGFKCAVQMVKYHCVEANK